MQLVTGDTRQGLKDIPATLLIPLAFRAQESRSPDPIIRDPHAVSIVDKIDFDFSRFERGFGNRMSRFGVATRTLLFDTAARRFLADYPNGLVLNVGCGLDARFYRVDNGLVTWIDVDVAESLELRRVFFEESERHRMLRGSVLERSWLADVPSDLPTLLLCEGTFMYFQEPEVKSFVNDFIESLPIRRLCSRWPVPGFRIVCTPPSNNSVSNYG